LAEVSEEEFYSVFLSCGTQPPVEVESFFKVGEKAFEMVSGGRNVSGGDITEGEETMHIVFDEAVGEAHALFTTFSMNEGWLQQVAVFVFEEDEVEDEALVIHVGNLAHECGKVLSGLSSRMVAQIAPDDGGGMEEAELYRHGPKLFADGFLKAFAPINGHGFEAIACLFQRQQSARYIA